MDGIPTQLVPRLRPCRILRGSEPSPPTRGSHPSLSLHVSLVKRDCHCFSPRRVQTPSRDAARAFEAGSGRRGEWYDLDLDDSPISSSYGFGAAANMMNECPCDACQGLDVAMGGRSTLKEGWKVGYGMSDRVLTRPVDTTTAVAMRSLAWTWTPRGKDERLVCHGSGGTTHCSPCTTLRETSIHRSFSSACAQETSSRDRIRVILTVPDDLSTKARDHTSVQTISPHPNPWYRVSPS